MDFFEEQEEEDMGSDRFDLDELFDEGVPNHELIEYPDPLASNRMVLETAIQLLEKSFFWKFKSYTIKLELIQETYWRLKNLLESPTSEWTLTEPEEKIDTEEE